MEYLLSPPFILLLQADFHRAKQTADYLNAYALKVEIVSDEVSALSRIRDERPDLVILDGMLSGRDGVDLCRDVRDIFSGAILMLTAHTELVDEILGLEMGADDYLQKPLEPRLLLARVKALLRRYHSALQAQKTVLPVADGLYKFADLAIDDPSRRVLCAGDEVTLTTPQYELLLLLAKNPGKILSRDRIFQSLRGIEYDGMNRFVDITVSQIRAQICTDKSPLIKTVRGQGYLLVPEPV